MLYFSGAFLPNYPEFPEGCLPALFAFLKDAHQMFVYRPNILLDQLGDERLRQPDRLVPEPALDARAAVFGLAEDDAGSGGGLSGMATS